MLRWNGTRRAESLMLLTTIPAGREAGLAAERRDLRRAQCRCSSSRARFWDETVCLGLPPCHGLGEGMP